MALLTMALLTTALLTMALLTMELLTMALLTMALLTMATLRSERTWASRGLLLPTSRFLPLVTPPSTHPTHPTHPAYAGGQRYRQWDADPSIAGVQSRPRRASLGVLSRIYSASAGEIAESLGRAPIVRDACHASRICGHVTIRSLICFVWLHDHVMQSSYSSRCLASSRRDTIV